MPQVHGRGCRWGWVTTVGGLDVSPPPPAPAGRSAGARRAKAVLLVMVLLGLAACFWVPWYRDRSYIGTTASVALEWSCLGPVIWRDLELNVKWDSAPGETTKAQLDALEGTATAEPYNGQRVHRARGIMEFTSYTDALFVSSTGAMLRFVRYPDTRFSTLGCAIN
jgi:hypothetical protein